MEHIAVSRGVGKYEIRALAVSCGRDLSVTLCGGTLEHVGAVSLAAYEPERGSATVSTVTAFTHRDDYIAARAAKALSCALCCTVTVTAGVHVDDASQQDISRLCENADAAVAALIDVLNPQKAAAPTSLGRPL